MRNDVLKRGDVTRPYVRRDLFVYETWLTFMECTHRQPRMLKRCRMMCWFDGTWLVHAWDVTHLYLWHDSLMVCISWQSRLLTECRMQCFMYMWDVTHFVRVTWLPHGVCVCVYASTVMIADTMQNAMFHVYVRRDSFCLCVTWLIHGVYAWTVAIAECVRRNSLIWGGYA